MSVSTVTRLSPAAPGMLRVHSENDTAVHQRVPHTLNNSIKEHQSTEVNSNHNQFSLGSTELLNGRNGSKTDTLTDKKSSKVCVCDSHLSCGFLRALIIIEGSDYY